ncbi:MAG: hypothetical protein ABI488_23660, partial [Polyangiaceae bacterium]
GHFTCYETCAMLEAAHATGTHSVTSVRMLTFLPFSRAVKAPVGSIAVCAVMLCVGCVSRGASSHTSVAPATGPQRPLDNSAADGAASALPVTLTDGGVVSDTAADAATPKPSPPLTLEFELPYPVDARPRSASPLQAAADDEALARWNLGGSADPSYPSSSASYHPGTRVVVDTELSKIRAHAKRRPVPKHGLTPERVQAQARAHGYWPFRLCFEAGQREKKGTGGETRVAFTVTLRGKASHAALLDSKLENPSTAACLVRATSRLEFTPRPQRALGMVASIRIWPGDADLPPLPAAGAVAASSVTSSGAFDAHSMRERVASKRAELSACFADARRSDPSLWGRLALAAILEVDGTVHQINEIESHFPNAAAARCAQVLLAGLTFPTVNGKPFTVVLPMRLSPSDPQKATGPELNPSPPDLDAGNSLPACTTETGD